MAKTLAQAKQKPNNIGELISAPAPVQNVPAVVPREQPGLAQATLGPAPAVWTTGYDSVKQFYRPGTSQQRFPPLPTKSNPQINAQAASVATTVVAQALTAQATSAAAIPVISENVQSVTSYLTTMADRDTLISMTNNSGGTVTLPGASRSFSHAQTVTGVGNNSGSVAVGIVNTLGNTMVVISNGSNNNIQTISDTNGNTWFLVQQTLPTFMWVAYNVKGGPNAVQVVLPPGNNTVLEVDVTVHEFSGILTGGIDSHGGGGGSASLTIGFPNTVAIGGFRFETGSTSANPTSPAAGWTGMPPNSGFPWFFPPPSAPPPPFLYVNTLDEYIFNPPVGPSFAVTGQGPGISSYTCVAANFKTVTTVSTIMPKGWFCYVENVGTGVFVIQSTANVDGKNQTITLQPNTGVLIVSDGVSYWTERGVAASILLETNGTPNLSQTVLNLVQGTNILLTNTIGGSVRIDATGGSALPYVMGGFIAGAYGVSQDLMSIPVDRSIAFVANFGVNTDGSQSQATLQVAATASTVFVINKVISGTPTQIGTITFAISGTVGTFASTGGAGQTLNLGDVAQVLAPASPDATAAGLGFTLSGTR
jgi:hypothetical protein